MYNTIFMKYEKVYFKLLLLTEYCTYNLCLCFCLNGVYKRQVEYLYSVHSYWRTTVINTTNYLSCMLQSYHINRHFYL